MNIAKRRLDHGEKFPYDAGADVGEDGEPKPQPAADWAHAAARGVLADLLDRRGIKWELEKVDHDVRIELTQSMAEIIRQGQADRMANININALALDRLYCDKIAALQSECQTLRGERAVLVRLLRAADSVLDTLDPESEDESERLSALRQAIGAAAQHQSG